MALTDTSFEPGPKPKSGLRAILPYTTVAMILAALYVAWTFYSRQQSAKEAQQALAAKQQEKREKVANQIFGSGEVKFTVFSADSGRLRRGETTQLCYGVLNAKTLKLDPPPAEEVKPTARHCIEIAPKKTTTYTLTAANAKGESQSQTLTIMVQ
jgi:hypothetical protein